MKCTELYNEPQTMQFIKPEPKPSEIEFQLSLMKSRVHQVTKNQEEIRGLLFGSPTVGEAEGCGLGNSISNPTIRYDIEKVNDELNSILECQGKTIEALDSILGRDKPL